MAAATVAVKEVNGASGASTYTTCGSTATSYFRVSDAHGNSTPSYKIPIPSSGINYSYWKNYAAEIEANAGGNTLDNWQFYLADFSTWTSALGTSGDIKVGLHSNGTYGLSTASYEQSEGQADSNGWGGKELTADHAFISSVENAPTTATQFDNNTFTSTGSTNHFVLQLHVDTASNSATFGAIGELVAYITYDES